jgi:hypothetical protein
MSEGHEPHGMTGMRSQAPSGSGHPRLERDDQSSLQTDDQSSLQRDNPPSRQRDALERSNRLTRRILLAIAAGLAVATLLAGIRW